MHDRTRRIALIALSVALTAAGARIALPVWPVPVTFQSFFVLLSGVMLGPGAGASAMGIYLAAGLAGLPVFSAGGGPHYVLLPSFGFALAFPAASAVAGRIARTRGQLTFGRTLAAMAAGTAVLYAIGVPWLAADLKWVLHKEIGARAVVAMGFLPFLPGDLLKVLLGAWIAPSLSRIPYLKRHS